MGDSLKLDHPNISPYSGDIEKRTLPMQRVKTWMLAAFVLQNAVSQPIRIGDFARQLASQDMKDLEQIAAAGGAKGVPWLLEGALGQTGNTIRIYLPADTQTAQL